MAMMNTLANCSVPLKNPDALTGKKNTTPTKHRELAPLTADPPRCHTMTITGPRPSTTQHARQPELPGPLHPAPAETITVKVKTNMWPEPLSIKPSRLACLPLPSEAEATNMKTMVVCIANAPKKPEDMTDYHRLWAGLVNGITIPEMLTRIFDILGQTADIQYYYCMAMGYAEHCHILAANQGHLQCSAVLVILVNLMVLRQQLPCFIQIYSQVLQQEPNLLAQHGGNGISI